tara:strand:- start:15312 stop:15830 length:519 start_codon:yes stop_codon:yes gene_type:complete
MLSSDLKKIIKSYQNFPKKGIHFRDIFPILSHPKLYSKLIKRMASSQICSEADAILAIDARGFLFGSGIALELSKPMIVARKPGKLPGSLISESYDLEYGNNSLSIQKDELNRYNNIVIVDDLLATGGTVKCVSNLLHTAGKKITGLSVVIELDELKGRSKLPFPVECQVSY